MKCLTVFLSVLFACVTICVPLKPEEVPPLLEDQFRVVNGEEAEPHSVPYIVNVLSKSGQSYLPFCSGVLITPKWILTAAHCLFLRARQIYISAGQHNAYDFNSPTQIRQANFRVRHERFDKTIGPNDIGLIRVSKPFIFDEYVQRVPLSTNKKPTGNGTIYGWGSINSNKTRRYPDILQTTNLTIISTTFCQTFFPDIIDKRGNFCAGGPDEDRGGCVGDSGGPLVQNSYLIGIVSWGPVTCNPMEGPSVFTNVAYYIDWISDYVDEDDLLLV